MFALDPENICYSAQLFTTAFNESQCSFEQYFETLVAETVDTCERIVLAACNIDRVDNVAGYNGNTMSATKYDDLLTFLKFGKCLSIRHAFDKL